MLIIIIRNVLEQLWLLHKPTKTCEYFVFISFLTSTTHAHKYDIGQFLNNQIITILINLEHI